MEDPKFDNMLFCWVNAVDYILMKSDFDTQQKSQHAGCNVGYRQSIDGLQLLIQISCPDDVWLKAKTYFVFIKDVFYTTDLVKIQALVDKPAWNSPIMLNWKL